jgi:hypothetical protein
MTLSRYSRTPILDFGQQYGTCRARVAIQSAIANGTLTTRQMIVRGSERLDTIAGEVYGDARYWWIVAACSNIGWGLQVPPGTILQIAALADVAALVG